MPNNIRVGYFYTCLIGVIYARTLCETEMLAKVPLDFRQQVVRAFLLFYVYNQ